MTDDVCVKEDTTDKVKAYKQDSWDKNIIKINNSGLSLQNKSA